MDTEQLLTVAQASPSVQQQYGAPQQLATNYFLLAAEQQPATMQQVVQPPQAPIVPSAPIQHVNQVAPQYSAPQYQAPQYRGGNHCAQQIVTNTGHTYLPDFNYKPNNYLALTVTLAIICGVFSVGSLFCTVPAIILSVKSKGATAAGKIKEGRRLGVCAVYLVIGAIVFALMIAIVLTGAMIPVLKSCPYYGGYSCRYYRYGYGR
ncbi:uncharacterized protein LOC135331886 [Halichondria panicea]|uniref:uncharacterized protein LOC135331886 n=1 Tax=Halichondria panicea TaxID=6063 RepID=UPI00312B30A9